MGQASQPARCTPAANTKGYAQVVKIAVAVCSYPPYRGGIGNAAARHAAALRDLGHRVTILRPAHDDPVGQETIDGIEVRRLPAWARHGVSALVPSIAAHLRGCDALYLHYPFYGGAEAAVLGATLRRIPLVVYFHMDVLAGGLRGAIINAYQRTVAVAILRSASRILVSSCDYAQNSSIGRLSLNSLRELPFSIDTDLFTPGAVDADLLCDMDLDPDRPIVLFVGGMDAGHAFKGVPILIGAMSELQIDEAQLVLVGDGELRPNFEQLARERCKVKVHFAGGVSDEIVRALYRAAAVTVLPSTSREEAFGIVLIESMASGTPVIAPDLPGVRTVPDIHSGLLVPPGDAHALRAAIRSLLADPQRRHTMGIAARQRAVHLFSRQREQAELATVFDDFSRR